MSALQAAGNFMVGGAYGKPIPNMNTLGVRSLREDYLKPAARADIVRNLRVIEERYDRDSAVLEPVASEERIELPRFQHLFAGGELMPPSIFMQALELQPSENLNGQHMPFDKDVLVLRDNLVVTYKPLTMKIRQLNSKEIDELPLRPVATFARAWVAFETAWLRNKEVHAVQALQPLAKAIISLEPLLLSLDKERLLPWPRVQHQKVVTLKCLEGFMQSLSDLASSVMPSLSRELDHDSRLLLLMDHVLSLRGEKSVNSSLDGVSATPNVNFPNHQGHRGDSNGALHDSNRGLTLDAYSFRLLGGSVGDAVAAGKLKHDAGNGQAGRAKLAMSGTSVEISNLRGAGVTHETAAGGSKETEISKRASAHAEELLGAFEAIKDFLLSLKSTLELIDPALDRDQAFMGQLHRFERCFRRAKRLFLEPDNLA